MSFEDNDLMREFIWSTREELQSSEDILLRMERGETGADDLNIIYRGFHSVKGSAGLTGLSQLEFAAHQGEELLNECRSDPGNATPALAGTLFFIDAAKSSLHHIEANGTEADAAYEEFLTNLKNYRENPPEPTAEIHAEASAKSTESTEKSITEPVNEGITQEANEPTAASTPPAVIAEQPNPPQTTLPSAPSRSAPTAPQAPTAPAVVANKKPEVPGGEKKKSRLEKRAFA